MKNKMLFRVIGALASALIIAAVFVPFVGNKASLWQIYGSTNSLYLPVMIVLFGAVGVIFFSLNIKTEFAYMSAGAIAFFIITKTFDMINQGSFDTVDIGYYFLIAGTLLTGIVTFISNLKSKNKDLIPNDVTNENTPEYNNEVPPVVELSQPINNVPIEPINENLSINPAITPIVDNQNINPVETTIQPIQSIEEQVPDVNPVISPVIENQSINTSFNEGFNSQIPDIEQQNITPEINPIPEPLNPINEQLQVNPSVTPINAEQNIGMIDNSGINSQVSIEQPQMTNPITFDNPVEQRVVNPVINEFNEINKQSNPVTSEFLGNSNYNNQPIDQFNSTVPQASQVIESTQVEQPQMARHSEDLFSFGNNNNSTPVEQFANQSSFNGINQNSNNVETDIFGQPINR